jgi:hypothetical protein
LEKKHPKNKKGQRSAAQKGSLWYNVELTQSQDPDEEMQPILWTEQPTGALVGCWFTLAELMYSIPVPDWYVKRGIPVQPWLATLQKIATKTRIAQEEKQDHQTK